LGSFFATNFMQVYASARSKAIRRSDQTAPF
jgi:hypothetical protein